MSLPPLTGLWRRLPINSAALARSSHVLSAVSSQALILTGELESRKPVDSKIHILKENEDQPIEVEVASAPPPRVGASSGCTPSILYLFGGRGGAAMTPLDEEGGVWTFTGLHSTPLWNLDKPAPGSQYPTARSYHSSCTTKTGYFYVHGGCLEVGRASDLWVWSPARASWTRLADAPGPPRGGTSICVSGEKMWRYGGFDGKSELGIDGEIDVYDIAKNEWSTVRPQGNHPGPRSVATLLPLSSGRLLTMYGEGNPSSIGHAGAGRFWDDIWVFETEKGVWREVNVQGEKPEPRGWFAADTLDGKVIMHGGLSGKNERLGDAWILELQG